MPTHPLRHHRHCQGQPNILLAHVEALLYTKMWEEPVWEVSPSGSSPSSLAPQSSFRRLQNTLWGRLPWKERNCHNWVSLCTQDEQLGCNAQIPDVLKLRTCELVHARKVAALRNAWTSKCFVCSQSIVFNWPSGFWLCLAACVFQQSAFETGEDFAAGSQALLRKKKQRPCCKLAQFCAQLQITLRSQQTKTADCFQWIFNAGNGITPD